MKRLVVSICFVLAFSFALLSCASPPVQDYLAAKHMYETKAPLVKAIDPDRYEEFKKLFLNLQREMDNKNWRKAKKIAIEIRAFEMDEPDDISYPNDIPRNNDK